MSDKNKLKLVEDFIYNDEVQNILSNINDNAMDFNILEITGMGTQEIKHSNILSWLFDDKEHNLEYQVLNGFLKKVIELNPLMEKKDILQSYLYLSDKKRDITIYREQDNIDLLIVDEANKIVIAIENKVNAIESEEQLANYKNLINKKYKKYDKYFIFLTIDLEYPSEGNENWLRARHQMTTEVIKDILKTKEITLKTKIILESYIDLLKRNGIVEDKKLQELCDKIWVNKKYRDALNILIENQSSNIERISNIITDKLETINATYDFYADKFNDILFKSSSISDELYNDDKIFYNISFGYDGIFFNIFIKHDDNSFDNLYKKLFPDKKKRTESNRLLNIRSNNWDRYIEDIGIENLEEEVSEDIENIFAELERCDKIIEKWII